MTANPLILLGVSGSIAAYKSPQLLRLLTDDGYTVRVAMTAAARKFVGALTFEALGGGPVYLDQMLIAEPARGEDDASSLRDVAQSGIAHTDLTALASALVVAPASADIIAKIAHGFGDDPVSALALALKSDAALVIAPAMNPRMWANPAVQSNIALLRERGAVLVGPTVGDMACGDVGVGRMCEPEEIFSLTRRAISLKSTKSKSTPLRTLILSGPTREPIDDVRFLSNGSSGRMGRALAEESFEAGHDVTVISGPAEVPIPSWIKTVHVTTAQEMLHEARRVSCDFVFSPAAISDYTPVCRESGKPAKAESGKLDWVASPDVLATLQKHWMNVINAKGTGAEDQSLLSRARKSGVLATPMAVSTSIIAGEKSSPADEQSISMQKMPVVVAFAAEETDEDFAKAVEKAGRKGASAIVLNEALATMGAPSAKVKYIVVNSGSVTAIGPAPKKLVAREILRLATGKL